MAVSRDELRYLLQQADRVLEIVPPARALRRRPGHRPRRSHHRR
ncbi:hypothetical protein QP028_14965 [Corynebacterium suedekumii]|nr:hypothetical protein QP028_14965 [Corynebacterium suedekumii]